VLACLARGADKHLKHLKHLCALAPTLVPPTRGPSGNKPSHETPVLQSQTSTISEQRAGMTPPHLPRVFDAAIAYRGPLSITAMSCNAPTALETTQTLYSPFRGEQRCCCLFPEAGFIHAHMQPLRHRDTAGCDAA
jgi:hypothetical protein